MNMRDYLTLHLDTTLKYMNCTVIALLHYLITARSLKLSIARTPIKYEINQ